MCRGCGREREREGRSCSTFEAGGLIMGGMEECTVGGRERGMMGGREGGGGAPNSASAREKSLGSAN